MTHSRELLWILHAFQGAVHVKCRRAHCWSSGGWRAVGSIAERCVLELSSHYCFQAHAQKSRAFLPSTLPFPLSNLPLFIAFSSWRLSPCPHSLSPSSLSLPTLPDFRAPSPKLVVTSLCTVLGGAKKLTKTRRERSNGTEGGVYETSEQVYMSKTIEGISVRDLTNWEIKSGKCYSFVAITLGKIRSQRWKINASTFQRA